MPVQTNQPRVWQWTTSATASTPENFLDLLQEFENSAGLPMSQADVNLTNSPTGVNITGRLADVRSDYDGQGKPEFAHGSFNLGLPPSGAALSVSVEFGRRVIAINLPHGAAADGDRVSEVARRLFPKADGPSPSELSAKDSRLSQLLAEAERTVSTATNASAAAAESAANAEAVAQTLTASRNSVQSAAEAAQEFAASANARNQESIETIAKIKTALAESQSFRDSAKAASDEAGPLLETIKAFAGVVDAESKKVRQLHATAGDQLAAAEKRSSDILTRHDELQDRIAEALQRAVGAGLFGAFNQRKRQIVISKWVWMALAVVAGAAQVGEIYWLAGYLKEALQVQPFPTGAFLLRASASIPIVLLLTIGLRQYGRERDFEEVYAFKAALSFSLKPYLDLVQALPNLDAPKHHEFITSTIRQVFEYPEKQREQRHSRLSRRSGGGSGLEELIQSVAKLHELLGGGK